MNRRLDTLIIADKGGYENVAFALDYTSLKLNGEIMTIQNLKKHFFSKNNLPIELIESDYLNYEMTGKLNGIYLYDYCTKNELNCALVDGIWPNEEEFIRLLEKGPRTITLSTTWLLNIDQVKEVTSFIRGLDKKIPIIVGGPLVFNSYNLYQLKDNSNYDLEPAKRDYFFLNEDPEYYEDIDIFIIEEQGEKTLVEVIHAINEGSEISDINNLAYRKKGNLIFTNRREENNSLNDNIISWHTLDDKLLPSIVPLRTSTGCMFKCEFCGFVHCRPFRYKKKDTLDEEIKRIAQRTAVKHIRVVDDTMYPRQIEDFSRALLENKVEIPWTTFVRADAINNINIQLLKRSNCKAAQIGLESGDDTILYNMNKRSSTKMYLKNLALLNEAGINVRASFIVGFPGENEETINNTIDFLINTPTAGDGLFDFSFAPFILVPLSPIFEKRNREKYGLQGYLFNWQHNTMKVSDIPKHIKNIFLSIKGDRYFVYTRDPIDPQFPIGILKKIKRTRQKIQQAKVRGESREKIKRLWKELERLFITS